MGKKHTYHKNNTEALLVASTEIALEVNTDKTKYILTAVGTRCADHVTPLYPQKLALTSPTGGGRSVCRYSSRAD